MSEKRICKATTSSGQRCRSGAQPGQEWCFNHDPRRAEERKANAAAGGRSRSRRQAHEVSRIKKRIGDATDAVLRGDLNSATAAVAFQGFNVLLRVLEVERRIREDDDFEERIAALENRARGNG
ncbi:MAG: DUF2746 domain-containing protein [Actinomycetota bacterium]|nr:DUF2746 domain-containing protein [Actinomycetota bacterium]